MADIQFNMTLDLVEQYVPAENITVVQENYQSVEFLFTIMNRGETVDLTGATNIVVSFIKPDGHIVLQNDGSLVNGKVKLVANPQAFTYVGKTYLQVQYKIGTKILNTRQAFIWVERGNTSCQTLSSTDFTPMLDQSIQAGQMLSGIDLQALIDSKVTAENAQKDVDALELRVGALEVTIVGLDSRVDTLEAGQATQDTRLTSLEGNIATVINEVDALQLTAVDHETRIDGLEANMPNLSPIEADITTLKAKDVEQDGRIGTNELAISEVKTKNAQQDTAIAGNATAIATVDTKVGANKATQDVVNSSVSGSLANHTSRIEDLEADATTDNARITNLEMDNTSNKNRIANMEGAIGVLNSDINDLQGSDAIQNADILAIKTKNTQQDGLIADNSAAIATNKADADSKITGLTTRVGTAEGDIAGLKTKDTQQDTRMTAIENKDSQQDGRLDAVEGVNTAQNNRLANAESKNTEQDNRLTAVEGKNSSQDTEINKKVNKAGDTMSGDLTIQKDGAGISFTTSGGTRTARLFYNASETSDSHFNIQTPAGRAYLRDGSNVTREIATVDKVVSKTGDTMTGTLLMEAGDFRFKNPASDVLFRNNASGIFSFYDIAQNNVICTYNSTTKEFNVGTTTNLLKRTGDTMSGDFKMTRPNATTARTIRWDTNGAEDVVLGLGGSSKWLAWDQANAKGIYEYDPATNTFNVTAANTNLLKKTGDTVTGKIDITGSGEVRYPQDTTQTTAKGFVYMDDMSTTTAAGIGRFRNPSDSYLYMGWGAAPWSSATGLLVSDNRFTYKGFKVTTAEKDGRADLTLTADATTFDAGYSPIADRRGNTVTLRMAIQRVAGSSSRIVTTLPTDMRPIATIVLAVSSTDGTMGKVTITTAGEIWIESLTATSILSKNLYISTSYVVN